MALRRDAFLFLIFLIKLDTLTSSYAYPIALPNCSDKCGNTSIPYPFGIGPGCYREGFEVSCNLTTNRTYLSTGNIEIKEISILPAEVNIYTYIASTCYSSKNNSKPHYAYINFPSLIAFLFSSARNTFTVIGCSTVASIRSTIGGNKTYESGCLSYCNSTESTTNGSCDGYGCCHTSIPKGVRDFTIDWGYSQNAAWEYNPCNYAFIANKDWYNFSSSDLVGSHNFISRLPDKDGGTIPTVLDWAIRDDGSCQDPAHPPEACKSSHSTCNNTANGVGYYCNCMQGFEGNPYLNDGCQDIDECKLNYTCKGICKNIPGDYECKCHKGLKGNGKLGTCTPKFTSTAKWAVGFCVGVVVLFASCMAIVTKIMSIKYKKEREEYFKKNGGNRLQEMISQQVETVRVFTEKELIKATNNFDKGHVIGSGGRGIVYKGILDNERVIAIKRCKDFDEGQKEEFVNEIVILSQINHRHVVRLLGCCLEVDIPMLVYEFIANGTLFDFLHGNKNRAVKIPLGTRLRVARESAEALAFMHTTINHPIVHGDVKSLNILLDDEFNAKVADFGASSLVPSDENQFINLFQWTVGYLDPECSYTNHLTEKSDVFAFGVVILELMTRKQAIYMDESGEKKSLVHSFHVIMKEDRLVEILDPEIVNEISMVVLVEVAALASRCIKLTGDERPMMIEVAETLQMLMKSKSFQLHKNQEEMTSFSKISPHTPYSFSSLQNTETTKTETTSALLMGIGR